MSGTDLLEELAQLEGESAPLVRSGSTPLQVRPARLLEVREEVWRRRAAARVRLGATWLPEHAAWLADDLGVRGEVCAVHQCGRVVFGLLSGRRVQPPSRAREGDAGWDIAYTMVGWGGEPHAEVVAPGEVLRATTGLVVALPPGTVGLLCGRSGLAAVGLHVVGGVVDAGYRGELVVLLANLSRLPRQVALGARVAQLLCLQLADGAQVGNLPQRGAAGFGSSG